MIFEQKEIRLKPYVRGFHLITDIIIAEFPAFRKIEKGILKIFIKHTSASLTKPVKFVPMQLLVNCFS